MLGRGAGDVILEHAFEAGRVPRVEAAVEHLSTFGSGYMAVTDEAHGVCRPEKPISVVSHRKQIFSGLSWTHSDKRSSWGEAGAIPDKHAIFVNSVFRLNLRESSRNSATFKSRWDHSKA